MSDLPADYFTRKAAEAWGDYWWEFHTSLDPLFRRMKANTALQDNGITYPYEDPED